MVINIFTDGGSRGNPGPSAIGVFIADEKGRKLFEIGKRIGVATNNFAEYSAIIEGYIILMKNKNKLPNLSKINFLMDSQLAASQLNGLYKVKNSKIREQIFKIREMEAAFNIPITYSHVRREENKKADFLVNLALDNKLNLA